MSDKPKPDFTMDEFLDEMIQSVFPRKTPLYHGPGAYTAKEISRASGYSLGYTYRMLNDLVDAGQMVRVQVFRDDLDSTQNAWIKTEVYEAHKDDIPTLDLG